MCTYLAKKWYCSVTLRKQKFIMQIKLIHNLTMLTIPFTFFTIIKLIILIGMNLTIFSQFDKSTPNTSIKEMQR